MLSWQAHLSFACLLVGTNCIHNCALLIDKTIQIVLSKVLTTYTIYGFIHYNFSIGCIHTFFSLQLLFVYFSYSLLALIIKFCDQGFMIHLKNTIVSKYYVSLSIFYYYFYLKLNISNIYNIKCKNVKIKNRKSCDSQPNIVLNHILCFYYIL
jgi:hypothetical protein